MIAARDLFFSKKQRTQDELKDLEREFFSTLKLKNGTYKITYHNRLDDLNEFCQTYLPLIKPLKIMDVAVSSGITTIEWMTFLKNKGTEAIFIASDSGVNASLISIGKSSHVLVDKTGHILQFEYKGKIVNRPIGRRNLLKFCYPLLFMFLIVNVYFWSGRSILIQSFRKLILKIIGVRCQALKLVTQLLCEDSTITIEEDDILTNNVYHSKFDVIRAANVLHSEYYDVHSIRKILLNLRSRLVIDGILIICRTNSQNINHASIFKLTKESKFELISRFRNGCDIDEIVASL